MRWNTIVLGALLAGGCNGGNVAQPDATPTPQPLTPGLSLSSSEGGLEAGVVGHQFNFGQLRDLWVRATMPSIGPVATEHLTFLNPLGELMFETTRAFSLDPAMQEMPMPGKSSPMTVFRAKPIAGGYAIDVGLPVWGTTFTRYPTTAVGDWQIKAEIDGVNQPLTTTMTVSFER
jgi:hypothetical protein